MSDLPKFAAVTGGEFIFTNLLPSHLQFPSSKNHLSCAELYADSNWRLVNLGLLTMIQAWLGFGLGFAHWFFHKG